MSSTNRSKARDKHLADYYITPQKPIKSFLKMFCEDEGFELKDKNILDPCAGGNLSSINKETGEIRQANGMSYPTVLKELGATIVTINDLRKDSLADNISDFIEWENISQYDLIITNPPFNIAQNIITKALECCKEGGYVIMLLRLNYFGGKVRQEFWKKNMPIRAYIHNKRIGFTQDGKTDSIEYMHAVWKKGYKTQETKLKLIYDF